MRMTAATMKLTVVALDQPSSLPRTSANTSRKRLAENEINPTQSMERARTSFDLAMRVSVTKMATTPMGTLTKKIQRQPMPLVMAPPTKGPTATAPPITPP